MRQLHATQNRISKRKARMLFANGHTMLAIPVNMRLDNMFMQPFKLKLTSETPDFDALVNQIEHYNCNSECGRYLAFYEHTAKSTNT